MMKIFTALACLMLLTASAAGGTPSAEDIVNATSVKGGLVVHLGCGDGHDE